MACSPGEGWGVYLDLVSRLQSVFCVYQQMLDAGTFGRNFPVLQAKAEGESIKRARRKREWLVQKVKNMDAIIVTHMCSQNTYFSHFTNDSCIFNCVRSLRVSAAETHIGCELLALSLCLTCMHVFDLNVVTHFQFSFCCVLAQTHLMAETLSHLFPTMCTADTLWRPT